MAEKYKHLFKFDMPTCEADAQELCYIARLVDEAIEELVNENKELRSENARLKAQVPKWHKVADGDLPNDKRDVIAFTKFSRYIDNYLGFYHDEHHWRIHDKVVMWCEIPLTPPTTEESSEKENK